MFELTLAFRYLIPQKKSLSTALISLLSVVVISLVVWLVLVFLSVTSGIERNWMEKLTSLHAPLRLTPTEQYYNSYYYQADALSAASSYTLKTIGEKANAIASDPYSENTDAEVPHYWPSPDRHPDGRLRDLVKETFDLLGNLKIPYQDYEISGALMRLSLNRPSNSAGSGATLSQMSYLLSFMDRNPRFGSIITPPSSDDLNALLKMPSNDPHYLSSILSHAAIDEIATTTLDPSLLSEQSRLVAFARPFYSSEIAIPADSTQTAPLGWTLGRIAVQGSNWAWHGVAGEKIEKPVLKLEQPLTLNVKVQETAPEISHVRLYAQGSLQNQPLKGDILWGSALVAKARVETKFAQMPPLSPPWAFEAAGRCHLPHFSIGQPFLLPKAYRDMGVRIGDGGTLNFSAVGAASAQEQRIPVRVAGFYDPGLFSMGGRCLIVPPSITRTIHAASQTFSPDGTPTNGIGIWIGSNDEDAQKLKIEEKLREANLLSYWKVSTYKDYEFSKELFQQFRSDRTLFLLIAVLILLVATSNIISLLVLLVNDKKKEIAILQSMGASGKSVAAIFGLCGLTMGAVSSIIGTAAAIFTLHHLDIVVHWLSALQGHAAFQPAFFGQSLPNQLSPEALLFVLISTPLLSLLAGLIPALRASRIRPSMALRQE
ncbi:MAG: hypothetical protein HW387_932 [Parachlamydiales bacterium]|nr:hypothetical protein [Parachlamydiales bacterium]